MHSNQFGSDVEDYEALQDEQRTTLWDITKILLGAAIGITCILLFFDYKYQRSRADRAEDVCREVRELIEAQPGIRVMYPVDADPDEQLRFILDEQQRAVDAGNKVRGGIPDKLVLQFNRLPVRRPTQGQQSESK